MAVNIWAIIVLVTTVAAPAVLVVEASSRHIDTSYDVVRDGRTIKVNRVEVTNLKGFGKKLTLFGETGAFMAGQANYFDASRKILARYIVASDPVGLGQSSKVNSVAANSFQEGALDDIAVLEDETIVPRNTKIGLIFFSAGGFGRGAALLHQLKEQGKYRLLQRLRLLVPISTTMDPDTTYVAGNPALNLTRALLNAAAAWPETRVPTATELANLAWGPGQLAAGTINKHASSLMTESTLTTNIHGIRAAYIGPALDRQARLAGLIDVLTVHPMKTLAYYGELDVTYTRDVLAKWLRVGSAGGGVLSAPEQYGRGLRNYTDSAFGYTLIEVQGAGHFNLFERPNFWDPLNDLIAEFDSEENDE